MIYYEYLTQEKAKIKEFIKNGLISPSILGNYDIYTDFLKTEEMEERKMYRYECVAIKNNCSVVQVRKIISIMQKPFIVI
jgi:hypothetical protein